MNTWSLYITYITFLLKWVKFHNKNMKIHTPVLSRLQFRDSVMSLKNSEYGLYLCFLRTLSGKESISFYGYSSLTMIKLLVNEIELFQFLMLIIISFPNVIPCLSSEMCVSWLQISSFILYIIKTWSQRTVTGLPIS